MKRTTDLAIEELCLIKCYSLEEKTAYSFWMFFTLSGKKISSYFNNLSFRFSNKNFKQMVLGSQM